MYQRAKESQAESLKGNRQTKANARLWFWGSAAQEGRTAMGDGALHPHLPTGFSNEMELCIPTFPPVFLPKVKRSSWFGFSVEEKRSVPAVCWFPRSYCQAPPAGAGFSFLPAAVAAEAAETAPWAPSDRLAAAAAADPSERVG